MSTEEPLALTGAIKKRSKLIVIILTSLLVLAILGTAYYYYAQQLDTSPIAQIKTESYKLRANRIGQIIDLNAYIGQELNQDDLIARYDSTAEIAELAIARTALQNIYYGNESNANIINEENRRNIMELEERSLLAKKEELKAQKLMQDWSKEHSRLVFELRKTSPPDSALNQQVSQAKNNLSQAKDYYELKSLERSKLDSELNKLKSLNNASSKEQQIAYWANQMRMSEQKILSQNIFVPFPCFVDKIDVQENQIVSTNEVIISLIPKLNNKIWLEAQFPKTTDIKANAKAKIIRKSDGLELEGVFGETTEKRNSNYTIKVYFKSLDELNLGAEYVVKIEK